MDQENPRTIYKNEEDRRLARIISILVWVTWGVYLFVIITALYFNDQTLLISTLTGCALLFIPLVLLKHQQLRASSLVVVLIELGTVTIIATVGQGIRDLAVISFPIIIIFAGMALNRGFFRISVGFTLLAVFWLVIGENFGWFVTKPFIGEMTNWFYLICVTLILLVAALAVDLLVTNLRMNLDRAHSEIAQRKQVEESLRVSEERYRLLANNIPDIIYSLDGEGNIVTVNSSAFERYGYTEQDAKGKPFLNFIHPEDREIVIGSFLNALTEQRKFTHGLQFRIVAANGTSYWFELNSQAHFDSLQRYTGEEGVLRDITERKRAETQINQLNAELEQRVEERTRELRDLQEQLVRHEKLAVLGKMAGSVGHELRNPLGVINTSVYYLKLVQPDANDKIKQHLAMIEQEVCNSEKIIGDLLDFARIKTVERETIPVARLVGQTLERFPVPANVELVLDLPEDLPTIYADPRQMVQVLGNLTTNACQAMPDGGRLVIRAGSSTDNGRSSLAISVMDSGVGISPEHMGKLFEPLFTTKPNGIGLGLPICQKLVEANGGRIEVKSEPGQGSTFTLVLNVNQVV
jgi:PAS domain S-box-containing protein